MNDLTNIDDSSKKKNKSVLKFCPICRRTLIEETPHKIMTYLTCLDCNAIVDYYYPLTENPIYNKLPVIITEPTSKKKFSKSPPIQPPKEVEYKNPLMENQLLIPAHKLELPSFNKNSIEHIIRLETELLLHMKNNNVDKIAIYIRFLLNQWPDISQCPIDLNLIIDALRILKG